MNDRNPFRPSGPVGVLLLPRLRVQNANAVSGPLTWGFPAPSAFLGFAHALERRLAASHGVAFEGVGIVCHGFDPQVFTPNRRRHLVFTQSRNPVYLKRDAAKFVADGTPPAIVEEGKAHLEVSLVLGVRQHGFIEALEGQMFAEAAGQAALGMRLAGGSILPAKPRWQAHWLDWPESRNEQCRAFARLRRRLLPGFALVHRPDLLAERLAALQAEAPGAGLLDALLHLSGLNHAPVPPVETAPPVPVAEGEAAAGPGPQAVKEVTKDATKEATKVAWDVERRPGWLVPLPVGYAGLSPLHGPGEVGGARDDATPLRFVESLYSLGQWLGPHRLGCLEQLLWHSTADPLAGLYRCTNHYVDHVDTLAGAGETTMQGA
ncbi:type I-F CRISPR-associated protein Csy2 [Oryzomicrobium sp.]|uniref:type I-F CRISPR-associated protein Csy2 n=1 Tax=Oryzomicrobium sp. TaxID=1911578 RepID=UPI0025D60337|nr:type I-F CRISPR-associated protein Csy2 [Oryzomicrobium sp.]MCE1243455.1 type I-F CRISPR-associated protein Csy2 [Oryzomicrobium sp.]